MYCNVGNVCNVCNVCNVLLYAYMYACIHACMDESMCVRTYIGTSK